MGCGDKRLENVRDSLGVSCLCSNIRVNIKMGGSCSRHGECGKCLQNCSRKAGRELTT